MSEICKMPEFDVEYWLELADKVNIEPDKLARLVENDIRMRVIIWDSAFDNLFEYVVRLTFSQKDKEVAKLFNSQIGGPLVSLTNKARLVYALGLINKTSLKDLEIIHNIRNIFAHNPNASFANDDVCKQCKKLSIAKDKKITQKTSYDVYVNSVNKVQDVVIKILEQSVGKLKK